VRGPLCYDLFVRITVTVSVPVARSLRGLDPPSAASRALTARAAAAGVTLAVLPTFGWRAVFFVGILPALAVLWIRKDVPESEIWLARGKAKPVSLSAMWRPDIRWKGVIATLMNACAMFGYWGLFTWIPGYLALSEKDGGRGLGIVASLTWVLFMAPGKWLGYVLFGFSADKFGRKRSYVVYLVVAAILVPIFGMTKSLTALLILGPFVGFFGTGYFSGFAAIASELFPTEIRATAMGLSYNIGRGFSAPSSTRRRIARASASVIGEGLSALPPMKPITRGVSLTRCQLSSSSSISTST